MDFGGGARDRQRTADGVEPEGGSDEEDDEAAQSIGAAEPEEAH